MPRRLEGLCLAGSKAPRQLEGARLAGSKARVPPRVVVGLRHSHCCHEVSISSCPNRGCPCPSRKARSDAEGEEEENLEEGKENMEEGKGGETDNIDNPYLRPVKLPRKKKPKT